MTTQIMIERVAVILSGHFAHRQWSQMAADRADLRAKIKDGFDVNEPTQHDCIEAARAALEAMMEPTEEMLVAISPQRSTDGRDNYQAMIQRALETPISHTITTT